MFSCMVSLKIYLRPKGRAVSMTKLLSHSMLGIGLSFRVYWYKS